MTEWHPLKILISVFCFSLFVSFSQEAVVSCWVQFSDGAVAPLELFDRSIYSLTVSTQDDRVATVRRTPLSTFVVAQGESKGQAVLVRAELRICEECQKSKRKSKLAVGTGALRINFQSSSRAVLGGGGVVTDGKKGYISGASEVTSWNPITVMDKLLLSSAASDSTLAATTTLMKPSTKYVQPHVV